MVLADAGSATGSGAGPSAARSSAKGTAPVGCRSEGDDGDRVAQLARHRDHVRRLLGTGEHRGGSAVAQHERQLRRGEHDVHRVDDRPGLERAVVGDDPLPAVLRVEGHRLPMPQPPRVQRRRDAVALVVQLAIGHRPGRGHECDLVAEPRGDLRQQLAETVHVVLLPVRRTPRTHEQLIVAGSGSSVTHRRARCPAETRRPASFVRTVHRCR